jgi:biopolymer transport protein ExbB
MPAETTYPLVQYFKDGGPVMWPLLLCSIAALTVILYKGYQFLTIRGGLDPLMSRVQSCLEAGNSQEAQEACEAFHGPVGTIVRTGLANAGQPKAVIREAVQDAGTHELAMLESLLPVLQTVGNIAPLLGFLGTVLGMIDAFFAVARAGLGDPGTIASGVAEALITTAAGLMIAVPTFAAYNYFVARVTGYSLQMERAASHVISLVAAEEGNSK